VLPFHQLGQFKWHELKMNYTLESVQPPSTDLKERAAAIFRAEGLKTH